MRATPGARMVPGSWETSLMVGFPHTINRKARQTLRWLFKDTNSTLVDLRCARRWQSVERLMNELNAESNSLARPILNAIESVLREHHAHIPSLETMLFNPRLNQAARDKRIEEMSVWLPQSDTNDPATWRERPSKPYQVLGAEISDLLGYRKEVAVDILNVIFDAACRRSAEVDIEKGARTEDAGTGMYR